MKKNNALAGIDIVIAVVAIIIFSTLILSLITTNVTGNVKIAKETIAMIYMTEIFEKIGTANYDNVTKANKEEFISSNVFGDYEVEFKVTEHKPNGEADNIMKKIELTLKYKIGDKTYECSMERLKAR